LDIVKLLPEYLDLGVDADELVAISQAALAKRIRDLKLAIAEAVVQARACTLMDNLEGSHQALHRARQLQQEYHHFHAEWSRLQASPSPLAEREG
jgi:trehalose-6-phosphate synthase